MRARLKPLSEQVLVITGGSSGIGLATARAAVRRGAAVVLAARNEAALGEIADELRAFGGRVAICAADVSSDADVDRIAATAEREFGGFDTWVNNAAVSVYGTIEQIGIEDHRRIFNVNYFGLLKGSLVALDHLRRRGGGAIINIGSVLSDRSVIIQGAYSASKHAVRSLTTGLRMDIERERLPISVTLIKPAGMHTPYPEHARTHLEKPPRVPPVLYAPELVAEAILFAAEHPRRQLYVGGSGFMISAVGNLFPRVTDRVMEAALVQLQQTDQDDSDPAMRDNLYHPRHDGVVDGNQNFHVRRQSLFLQAQKRPLLASGLAVAAAGVVAYAALRGPRRDKRALRPNGSTLTHVGVEQGRPN